MQDARSLMGYLQARFARGLSSPWLGILALTVAVLVARLQHAGATDALLWQHTLTFVPFGFVVSRTLFGIDTAREVRALAAWRILPSPGSYLALHLALFALWFAGTSVLTLVCARTSLDPALGHDLVTTLGVALLGALAYAPMAAWAATFRYGAWLLPLVDLTVGAVPGLGLLLPHPHLRSLLGGDIATPFGEPASSVYLLFFAVAAAAVAHRRMKRLMLSSALA